MCGLAAIYAYGTDAPPVDGAELDRIGAAMTVRGPDDDGSWFGADGRIGLAHRRLAILDPSPAGHQPMELAGEAGRLVIVYNGEIYNFRSLRAELVARGERFESASDTEVILRLYARLGPAFVEKLRGMYGLAIWDEARRGLFLARDPFGIKPLYFADDGATVRVASQVKALRAGGALGSAPDAAGRVGFYLFGSVPEPHTFWRDIRALPAGHHMWIDDRGRARPAAHFSMARAWAEGEAQAEEKTEGEAAASLRDALSDSVAHHLVSDVPVGVFLSGGLDSATVAAIAQERAQAPLRTINLAFDEYRDTALDESSKTRWTRVLNSKSVPKIQGGLHAYLT